MFKFCVFILFLFVRYSTAVIYSLNESEYYRMPPLYALDAYRPCMLDPGATYCLVDVLLHAERPSELMTLVQEYSAHTLKHFNHTQVHRGVCVQRTCKPFIEENNLNSSLDLNATLEACLNESLWRSHEVQGKLLNVQYCIKEDEPDRLDVSDAAMAVVYLIIIMLNLIGFFYDRWRCMNNDKAGNPYLVAFSMRQNWARLTAPADRGVDPRLDRLKLFNGLRTMTMICVFFSHTSLTLAYSYIENPLYVEKAYDDPLKQILFNGTLVTLTFFVMSAFLLAYNLQLHAETRPLTWLQWPQGCLLRWLRLTPTYALILGTLATWMRHVGSGPLWPHVVTSESRACRRYWWTHLLYINNYYLYHDNYCAPETWYLAADTQLFCVGLLVCVLARTPKQQKIAISLLFLLSLIPPAAHTYFQDLDAVVMQSPEKYRNLYKSDPTYQLRYIRGHTNLSTYTLGLAGGLLTYYWQKGGKDFTKYQKYRFLYWLIFPAGVAVILSGGLFYMDGPRPALLFRVLYATCYKPVFQSLIVALIVGCIFKFDSVYRSVMEWRGFTWTGRVCYSAYLVHSPLQRAFYGAMTQPQRMSNYFIFTVLAATTLVSFVCAAILWLAVEAPINQLVKTVMAPKRRHLENNMAAAEAPAFDGPSKL